MEMYWNGEESGVISRRLNIPAGTIFSWIHDFGHQQKRTEPLKKQLKNANNASEWLMVLRESTPTDTFEKNQCRARC